MSYIKRVPRHLDREGIVEFIRKNYIYILVLGVAFFVAICATPRANAAACDLTAKLVNPCRPLLGATASNYSGVSGPRDQIQAHESRIGRPVDIVHLYHPAGTRPMSESDKYFANRPNTILSVTWKPARSKWAEANGSNAQVNAEIDAAADSIKALGSTKIMLTLHHEPENDVSGGAPGCNKNIYKGSYGTPADYRAMWHNVRQRFDNKKVTNVVWAINFMGFQKWDCMIADLWPGNDYVDWIHWDPYSEKGNFKGMVQRFYTWMEDNSTSEHDYVSKAWGLAEWGSWLGANQYNTYRLYAGAKQAIQNDMFPRLKAYMVFDAMKTSRIGYDRFGQHDPVELAYYRWFASDPRFTDSYYSGNHESVPTSSSRPTQR
ncbi:MAG: hypothetical protein JWL85_596 [Candidatus Saccharibacteria bacterium]|nr:hypothetical protein [Candidatus Saccharibacteria bacterium]